MLGPRQELHRSPTGWKHVRRIEIEAENQVNGDHLEIGIPVAVTVLLWRGSYHLLDLYLVAIVTSPQRSIQRVHVG